MTRAILACIAVTIPLWLVNSPRDVLWLMVRQTSPTQGGFDAHRAWMNATCWWYSEHTSNYLAGPLLDPTTGALALVGLVLAVWEVVWHG